jgi:hypothetical protein
MGIVNRRNAVLGWLAWNVAKRVLARKARSAVPAVDMERRRPNRAATISLLAALGLGAWAARHYMSGDDEGKWESDAVDEADTPGLEGGDDA